MLLAKMIPEVFLQLVEFRRRVVGRDTAVGMPE
jgi:hypothetical protein